MSGTRTARALGAAAVAACLLGACALRGGARRPDARGAGAEPLRIWLSPIVRWEPGAARAVELALENPTDRTLVIAAPDPENARVAVFARPDGAQVCGVEPREDAVAGARVALAPGDRAAVRVDLDEACGGLPPGEYRYEVSYRAPAPGGADRRGAEAPGAAGSALGYSGTLATSHGEVLVEGEPSEGREVGPPRAARRPPRR